MPAIWCSLRCYPRQVLESTKSSICWLQILRLPNRSSFTNTYGVGRFHWDRNLYSHYQLVWYKTVYDEWGEETIFCFCSKERNCRIFFSTTWKNSARLWECTPRMKPESMSHIYRTSDGFMERESLGNPSPHYYRIFHIKNMPFWCFSDHTWYSINCAIKREYFLS